MKTSCCLVLLFTGLAAPLRMDAALVVGNGSAYSTVLGISYQLNANLGVSQSFGVSGIDGSGFMTWSTANNWIAAMNAANYLGYSDWRLPHSSDNTGYNRTSSLDEMSHLYYTELGGTAAGSLGTVGPFLNLPNDVWSDHTASWNSGTAFFFSFGRGITPGYQTADWKETSQSFGRFYSAWAVRDGDATVAVPEPSRAVLLLVGFAALLGRRHRRQTPGH